MRTLRLTLAGTAILALLGGPGGAVLAQGDDEAHDAADLLARLTIDGGIITPGTLEFGEDVIRYRGLVEGGTVVETSDPRFSGTWTWTGNRDQYSEPVGFWLWNGSFRVENEDGAWQERPTVWLDGRGERVAIQPVTSVFTGEGAYEGWSIVAEINSIIAFEFDGVIFEGEPPLPPAD